MTNLASEYVKNELENYRYRYNNLKKLALRKYEIDVIRGMHSPKIKEVCVQGSSDNLIKEYRRLDLIELNDENERQLAIAIKEMKSIQKILLNIEDKKLVLPIFKIHCLKESTYFKEANKLYIHEKTLQRQVNRELKKTIERD